MESATIDAKIDKITEKRQFPVIFFLPNCLLFNFTYIPTDNNNKKWNILNKLLPKTQFTPYQGNSTHVKGDA